MAGWASAVVAAIFGAQSWWSSRRSKSAEAEAKEQADRATRAAEDAAAARRQTAQETKRLADHAVFTQRTELGSGDMTQFEWWYDIDPGFVGPAELLPETFTTRVSDYEATVHMPSVTLDDGVDASWLAPPRIGGRPPARSEKYWGMIHVGTKAKPVEVVIQQLALTAEMPDGEDLQRAAESIVGAMDTWWDNVRGWLETVTGQHLTQVGHRKTEFIGNKTPIWTLLEDGTHGTPISIATTSDLSLGQVHGVTADIFRECVSLAGEEPGLAWTLLRDARSLSEVGQYRRAVIDAATAAEVAVSAILDTRLQGTDEQVRKALLASNRMLGPKGKLLNKLGCPPLPSTFDEDLVKPRNDAVHKGEPPDGVQCRKAISMAVEVVDKGFPLPTPPGSVQPLQRLW